MAEEYKTGENTYYKMEDNGMSLIQLGALYTWQEKG
jgi:hypothetical protein